MALNRRRPILHGGSAVAPADKVDEHTSVSPGGETLGQVRHAPR